MLNQVTENKENIEEIHQEFIEMKEEFEETIEHIQEDMKEQKMVQGHTSVADFACPQGDLNYRSVEGLCYYFNPTPAGTHATARQKCAGK